MGILIRAINPMLIIRLSFQMEHTIIQIMIC
jgi:hypothetical protein